MGSLIDARKHALDDIEARKTSRKIRGLEAEIAALKAELDGEKAAALNYQADAIKAEKQLDELLAALEDKSDVASKALRRAFQLGQTYWQQADSEYHSQNAKADATQARFQDLVDETRAAIASVEGGAA